MTFLLYHAYFLEISSSFCCTETHETGLKIHTHIHTRPVEQGIGTDVVSTVRISLLTASIEELKQERVRREGVIKCDTLVPVSQGIFSSE